MNLVRNMTYSVLNLYNEKIFTFLLCSRSPSGRQCPKPMQHVATTNNITVFIVEYPIILIWYL